MALPPRSERTPLPERESRSARTNVRRLGRRAAGRCTSGDHTRRALPSSPRPAFCRHSPSSLPVVHHPPAPRIPSPHILACSLVPPFPRPPSCLPSASSHLIPALSPVIFHPYPSLGSHSIPFLNLVFLRRCHRLIGPISLHPSIGGRSLPKLQPASQRQTVSATSS